MTTEVQTKTRLEYFEELKTLLLENINDVEFKLVINSDHLQKLNIEKDNTIITVLMHNTIMAITGATDPMLFDFTHNINYKSFSQDPMCIANFSNKLIAISDQKYQFEPSIVTNDILDAIDLDDIDFTDMPMSEDDIKEDIDLLITDIHNLLIKYNNDELDDDALIIMTKHVINYRNKNSKYDLNLIIDPDDSELLHKILSSGKVLNTDIIRLRVLLWFISNNPEKIVYPNKKQTKRKKK